LNEPNEFDACRLHLNNSVFVHNAIGCTAPATARLFLLLSRAQKPYTDGADSLRFLPGLSSSWRSNTSKKNLYSCFCDLALCQTKKAEKLVFELPVGQLQAQADYTGGVVLRFQRQPGEAK
jgi:hypothetical protein